MSIEGNNIEMFDTSKIKGKSGFQKLIGKKPMTEAEVDKATKEFEAVFIAEMLKNMFSTVKQDGLMSGGSAEENFKSFMIDEYGKIISRSGGIGIASSLKAEILKLQEITK